MYLLLKLNESLELKIQKWLHSDTRIQFQILRVTKYKS